MSTRALFAVGITAAIILTILLGCIVHWATTGI